MAKNRRIDFTFGAKVDQGSFNSVKRSFEELNKTAAKNKIMLTYDEELQKATVSAQKLQSIFNQSWDKGLNQLDLTKFNKSLSGARTSFQDLEREFSKTASGKRYFEEISRSVMNSNTALKTTKTHLDKMAETFSNTVTWGISSRIFNELVGSIRRAHGYVKDLDESLNDIRIVTGKSADEMERFAKTANYAAKGLAASTTDYTKASLIYYQQGLSDKEVKQRTSTTLKTANVTGQSTQQVSEELTAVWNGYKVAVEDTEKYIDKMAAVAANSASDLEELSTAIAKVASTAEAGGVTMDQLTAQISTIESVTRQAPESIGTALRTIYNRMSDFKLGNTTEDGVTLGKYTSELAKVGVNALDSDGNLKDLGTTMEEVGSRWNTFSGAQQKALAQVMGGTRQSNYIEALMNNWKQYQNMLDVSINSEGTLAQQQSIYMDSLAAYTQQLSTEIERTYDVMFDSDSYKTFLDVITEIVEEFNNFIEGIGGAGTAFIALGAIVTNIFSKQISRSIGQTMVNLKAGFSSMMFSAANGKSNGVLNKIVQGHNDRQEKRNVANGQDKDKGKWGQDTFNSAQAVAYINSKNGNNINQDSQAFQAQRENYEKIYVLNKYLTDEQRQQAIEANNIVGASAQTVENLEEQVNAYKEAKKNAEKLGADLGLVFGEETGEGKSQIDWEAAKEETQEAIAKSEKSLAELDGEQLANKQKKLEKEKQITTEIEEQKKLKQQIAEEQRKENKNANKKYLLNTKSIKIRDFNAEKVNKKGKNTSLVGMENTFGHFKKIAEEGGAFEDAAKYEKIQNRLNILKQKGNKFTKEELIEIEKIYKEYKSIISQKEKMNSNAASIKQKQDELNESKTKQKRLEQELEDIKNNTTKSEEERQNEIKKINEELEKQKQLQKDIQTVIDNEGAVKESAQADSDRDAAQNRIKQIEEEAKRQKKLEMKTKLVSGLIFAATSAYGAVEAFTEESATGAEKGQAAFQGLTGAINGLGMAFGPSGMLVSGLVTTGLKLIGLEDTFKDFFSTIDEKLANSKAKFDELHQEMQNIGSQKNSNANVIRDLKSNEKRIAALMNKMNESGAAAMTSEELDEWNGYAQQLAEHNENLLITYDEEGNSIIRNKKAISETIEKIKEKNKELEKSYWTEEKINKVKKAQVDYTKAVAEKEFTSYDDAKKTTYNDKISLDEGGRITGFRQGIDKNTDTGKIFSKLQIIKDSSHMKDVLSESELNGPIHPLQHDPKIIFADMLISSIRTGDLEGKIDEVMKEYEDLPLDELVEKRELIKDKLMAIANEGMDTNGIRKGSDYDQLANWVEEGMGGLADITEDDLKAKRDAIADSISTADVINVAKNDSKTKTQMEAFENLGLENGEELLSAYVEGYKRLGDGITAQEDYDEMVEQLAATSEEYANALKNVNYAPILKKYGKDKELKAGESIDEYLNRIKKAATDMYKKLVEKGMKSQEAKDIVLMVYGIQINGEGENAKVDEKTLDTYRGNVANANHIGKLFADNFNVKGKDAEKLSKKFLDELAKAGYDAKKLAEMDTKEIKRLYEDLDVQKIITDNGGSGAFKNKLDDDTFSFSDSIESNLIESAREKIQKDGGWEKILGKKEFDNLNKTFKELADNGKLKDSFIDMGTVGAAEWEKVEAAAKKYGVTTEEVIEQLKNRQKAVSASQAIDQLDSFGSQVDKGRTILQQKVKLGTNKAVDASSLKDLPDEWKEADVEGYEKFVEMAATAGTTAKELKDQYNKWMTDVFSSSSYLETLAGADEKLLKSQLEAIGITNAKSVAHEIANKKIEEENAAKKQLNITEQAFNKLSKENLENLLEEKTLTDVARQGVIDLTLAKHNLNLENFDFDDDIDALNELFVAANLSADAIDRMNKNKNDSKNGMYNSKRGESWEAFAKRVEKATGVNISDQKESAEAVRQFNDGLYKVSIGSKKAESMTKDEIKKIGTKYRKSLRTAIKTEPKEDTSSSRKGGEKAGKASEIDTKKVDEQYYESINAQIKTQSDLLGLLSVQKKTLIGADLVKNINAENTAIERQNTLLLENIKMAKNRIKEFQKSKNATKEIKKVTEETYTDSKGNTRKVNALKYVGGKKIKYDENGAILNGNEIQKAANEKLKREKEKYNSDVKKFKKSGADSKSAAAKRKKEKLDDRKARLEAEQKSVDNFSTYLKQRQEDYQEYIEALRQYEENLLKQIENEIEKSEVGIKLVADFTDFTNSLNDWKRNIGKDLVSFNIKVEGNNVKETAQSYIEDAENNMEMSKQYNDKTKEYLKEYEKGKSGSKSIFSKWNKETKKWVFNEELALKKIKETQKASQDYATKSAESMKNLLAAYRDQLDKALNVLSKMKSLYSDINGILQTQAEYALIINGSNTKEGQQAQAASLAIQKKNLEAQGNLLQQRKNIIKNEMVGGSAEEQEKYVEKLASVEKEIADNEKQRADNLIKIRDNAIEIARIDMEHSIFGTSLDVVKTKWELIAKQEEGYFDSVQKNNNILKISGEYDILLEQNKENLSLQQKINEQKQIELTHMQSIKKLSQGELKRQEALLSVLKAKIALEEAQKNKNAMRLRRDSQGNYTYQYTTNEKDVAAKKNDLQNAENELYNINKENFSKPAKALADIISGIPDALKKIYDNYGVNSNESKKAIEDLETVTKARLKSSANDLVDSFNEFFKDANINGVVNAARNVKGYENITAKDIKKMNKKERFDLMKTLNADFEGLTKEQEDLLIGKLSLNNYLDGQYKAFDTYKTSVQTNWNTTIGGITDINTNLGKVLKALTGNEDGTIADGEGSVFGKLGKLLEDYNTYMNTYGQAAVDLNNTLFGTSDGSGAGDGGKMGELITKIGESGNAVSGTINSAANSAVKELNNKDKNGVNKIGKKVDGVSTKIGNSGKNTDKLVKTVKGDRVKVSGSTSDTSTSQSPDPEPNPKPEPKEIKNTAAKKRKEKSKEIVSHIFDSGKIGDYDAKDAQKQVRLKAKSLDYLNDNKYLTSNGSVISASADTKIYQKGTRLGDWSHTYLGSYLTLQGWNSYVQKINKYIKTYRKTDMEKKGWKVSALNKQNATLEEVQTFFAQIDAILTKLGALPKVGNEKLSNFNDTVNTRVKKYGKDLYSFDTGGYTGKWNSSEGRIAMLHEKELVLNKEDTANMLKAVEAVRDIQLSYEINKNNLTNTLKNSALDKITAGIKSIADNIKNIFNGTAEKQTMEQQVQIDATFPNVKDAREVEEALKNLVSKANQYNMK